ncbi:hypothetical protein [Aeromonas enteropelogenes]|uniref:hypothetical protein n=1 Tax=Aeromonas enteropelogenes TaxID=29489 RepID=UPI003B9E5FF4
MNNAYVTRYNFKKFSYYWLQPDDATSIDKIFTFIYEKSLSDILNEQEATRLYVQKQMLEGQLPLLRSMKKHFHRNYIFSVTTPKYHKNNCCEFLKSDFSNYLVPPAIKALGEEKIKEFQEFCESTKKEFEGKTDDVFWAHVGIKFGVTVTPTQINYNNSGVHEIDKMSIKELQDHINEKLEHSLKMFHDKSASEILLNVRYAPHIPSAIDKMKNISDDIKTIVNEFTKTKMDIINSLFVLYEKQAKTEGYILPVELCAKCGLEPCKACWK